MNIMKLKTLSAGLLGALLVASATCAMAADIKERTIKYAVIYDIKHPHGLGAQKFADLVAQRSDNKMKVKVFPNATLGGEIAIISAMQGGTVEMSAVATSQLVGVIKDFAALDLPFLFSNEKEVDRVVDGPVGKTFLDKMPEKGMVGLSYFEHGFRNLTNSRRPVTKLEDIQGLKIRVEQNSVAIDTWNMLGTNAVPMPFPELYGALEQKAVDGQENPYSTVESSKFYEVQKYLSVTKHKYTPLVVTLSKKFWDQLSADEKKIIQDAAVEAAVYQRKANRDLSDQYLQSLKKVGMQINEIPAAELVRMRAKVVDKYSAQIGGTLVKDLFGEIEKAR
jgi:TRAP-type transport system periplasmic protein